MAEIMGIGGSYYSHMISRTGTSNLRIEHLERLWEAHRVSPLWVLMGLGPAILPQDEAEPHTLQEPAPRYEQPIGDRVEDLYRHTLERFQEEYTQRKKKMPALTLKQQYQLKAACAASIAENHQLETIDQHYAVTKLHLHCILKHGHNLDP